MTTTKIETIEQGFSSDLDQILHDAGSPTFMHWVGSARLYKFADGSVKSLHTEESDIQILSHSWIQQLPPH